MWTSDLKSQGWFLNFWKVKFLKKSSSKCAEIQAPSGRYGPIIYYMFRLSEKYQNRTKGVSDKSATGDLECDTWDSDTFVEFCTVSRSYILKSNASQKDIKLPKLTKKYFQQVGPEWWILIGSFIYFWDALGFRICDWETPNQKKCR